MAHITKKDEKSDLEKIAIIGMGCRFPGGANNPEMFWENIKSGVDCIKEIPEDRYNAESFYSKYKEKPGRLSTKWGGHIDGFDQFDPGFFGIPPREAHYMDPQQRKVLEVAWEALEDGGQKPAELAGTDVGVFIGAFTLDYKILQFGGNSYDNLEAHTATGSMMTLISNRISYIMDLKGPSLSVDTACSSSLVAVHLACESIRSGESSMALAGGVLLHCTPQYTIAESKGGFLSPTGSSHAFDSSANGYVRSEGVGVVVLKKLEDAIRDGDPIHAVIRGTGANQDGKTNGITVPNGESQKELIRKVYKRAGVHPSQVQYIEAHGTGTPVGDPIEANALGDILSTGRDQGDKCYIGSVKTNIGHTEAAAGVAGLIKTVMALKNKQIPPHLHLKDINPKIEIDKWMYDIPTELTSWPHHEGPALAGVNSFGFGGTNAHALLEEAPEVEKSIYDIDTGREFSILPLSAQDAEVFPELAETYKGLINKGEYDLSDIGYTLAFKKQHLEEGLSILYSSKEELAKKLDLVINGEADPYIVGGSRLEEPKRNLVWVFTGMGPQWWGMGRELYKTEPIFREVVDQCDKEMSKLVTWSLKTEWIDAEKEHSKMAETWLSQPANFALQIALAALWRSFGIEPEAIVGHSTGEVAAFYEAGVYSFEEAVKVIIHRSRLQETRSGSGKMAAVGLSEEDITPLLKPYGTKISIAAINSPNSVTLAGDADALAQLLPPLEKQEIFCKYLKVQIPFHSAAMDPIKDELLEVLSSLDPKAAQYPLYSTATGGRVIGVELDAEYWWKNIRGSVRFTDAMYSLLEDGYSSFLEIGPHPVLRNSIAECMEIKRVSGRSFMTLNLKETECPRFFASLAAMHNSGFAIKWEHFYPAGNLIALPAYPWKKERYWNEPVTGAQVRLGTIDHPLLGRHLWAPEPSWESKLDTEVHPYLQDHQIQGNIVFPGAGYIEMAFSALEILLGKATYSLDHLEFRKALFLHAEEPKRVQFLLEAEQSLFKIVTYNEDENHSSTVHALGKVRSIQNTLISPRVHLENIAEGIGTHYSSEDCYNTLSGMGYNYGIAFQGIQELWANDDEALARITLAENLEDGIDEYHFHPTLLDSCFQTLITTDFSSSGDEERGGIRLPISIEQLRLEKYEVSELWAHAKIIYRDKNKTLGDITIYDADGRVVGEVKGFVAEGVDSVSGHASSNTIDNWLFEINWMEEEKTVPEDQETAAPGERVKGDWLIFADSSELPWALKDTITTREEECLFVTPGEKFSINDGYSAATIRPGSESDLDTLVETAFVKRGRKCSNIIHLWNLDAPDIDTASAADLEKAKERGAHSVINLGKIVGKYLPESKVWFITRGAQPVEGNTISVPAAPVWGIGRVYWHQELMGNRGGLIDLDPACSDRDAEAALMFEEMMNPDDYNQELAFRNGRRYVSRLNKAEGLSKPLPTRFRPDGSFLVTGAFGALGQLVCRMMIKSGARRLILANRNPLPARETWKNIKPEDRLYSRIEFIKELEGMGAQIIVLHMDITDEITVQKAFSHLADMGYPPIRGVIHSAGIVKDTLLHSMDNETFDAVYEPKVMGSYLLHKYLKNHPIEYFILFSSVASLMTTAGQTNYAAGNAFLDALAHHRKSQGLPALSINWGPWAIGMIKDLNLMDFYKSSRGMTSTLPGIGMDILDRVIGQDKAQLAACEADWPKAVAWYPGQPSLFAHLGDEYGDSTDEGGQRFIDSYKRIPADERLALVEDHFYDLVVKVLHVKREQLNGDTSLNKLGLDSILAMELINKIRNDFEYPLTVVKLLSGASLNELSHILYDGINELLEQQGTEENEETYTSVYADSEEYPLSYGQQALWFIHQINPESPAYNVVRALEIPGKIDVDKMFDAARSFAMRHPALRTNFFTRDGALIQKISPVVKEDFKLVDVQDKNQNEIENIIESDNNLPFDLENDPLFRIRLYKRAEDNYLLVKTAHHIVTDATSSFLFIDEMQALYHEKVTGTPAMLEDKKTTYQDFVSRQEQFLQSKDAENMFNYWKNTIPEDIPLLDLPTDKQRPAVQSTNGSSYRFSIPADIVAGFTGLGKQTGATNFMFFLSAYYILLHKYTAQEDIVVGTPASGRTDHRFSDVYGYFINPLPLAVSFKDDPIYSYFLKQVQERVLGGLDNQDYPFALLVEKLAKDHDPSRSAIFQAMFLLLLHKIDTRDSQQGFPMAYYDMPEEEGQFDITLLISEDGENGSYHATIDYNTDLFHESTIKRMAGHYVTLLEDILKDYQKPVSQYQMLTKAEKQQVSEWGKGKEKILSDMPVHNLIENWAEKQPEAVAVAHPQEEGDTLYISYGELNSRANRIAHYLRDHGVDRNTIVGIKMEKSPELVSVILGILKAGGAYLPVDPEYPQERIDYMVSDSGVNMMIDDTTFKGGAIEEYSSENPDFQVEMNYPAYLIYTSGSTGKPKGVLVSHLNIASIYKSWEKVYDLVERTSSHLQMAGISFDVFTGDLFRALCSGGKLVLCDKSKTLNIPGLYDLMITEGIDSADFVPAVMRNLIKYMEQTGKDLGFFKHLVVGSDVWKVEEYRHLQKFCGEDTILVNAYGLTEAAVDSTFFTGSLDGIEDGKAVPIGRPFPNTKIYILDEYMKPVPQGVPGEIYIGGQGVALGYINNKELTDQRFITHSFDSIHSIRLYKTGDMGMWDKNGLVHILNRVDNQVKIRGFRVELGEIEKQLARYQGVEKAVVTAIDRGGDEKVLSAYYISESEIGRKELEYYLSERLPAYMVPGHFFHMDSFPLTPNGKVDLKGLPQPDRHVDIAGKTAASTIYEKELAVIWQNLLSIEEAAIEHDFFDLGGSSIQLIELIMEIKQTFNIQVPVNTLFSTSTLGGMAKIVEDIITGKRDGAEPYITFNSSADNTVYCFPPAGGYGMIYQGLAGELEDYRLVSFNYFMEENKVALYADLIEKMEDKSENTAITLFGYSLGGNMAFEVGKELEKRGRVVDSITILDSYRMIQEYTPSEKELEAFKGELAQHLEKHTGSKLVQEHTFEQARDAIYYFAKNLNTGSVKGAVNVVVEDNPENPEKIEGYDMTKEESWQNSSESDLRILQGSGIHEEMLGAGCISENGAIIKSTFSGELSGARKDQ